MAQSASKRVGRFSRQRLARLTGGARPGSGSESDGDGGSDGGAGPRQFVDVVVDHMAGGGGAAAAAQDGGSGRGRGAKRGAARSLMEAYVAAFGAGLDLELEEEWAEAEQRLESWSRERLAAEGVALFSMSAAADGQVYRDSVLKFFRPGDPLPFHALSQGDIVLISKGEPGEESLEGVVVDYSTRWLRVALPTQVAEHVRGSGWRLDLYANTIAHERAQAALRCFAAPAGGGGSGSSSKGGGGGGPDAESDGRKWAGPGAPGEGLWRALSGSLTAGTSLEQAAAAPPPWLRGGAGARARLNAAAKAARALAAPRPSGGRAALNASQARAVEAALGRSLSLWQGPPGTGKTRTLLRLCQASLPLLPAGGQVLAVAASNVAVDNLVLAVAASNVAVDNLVAGLVELGVRVVRVGQPVKVSPELRAVTLEALAAFTPPGAQAGALRARAAAAPTKEAVALWRQAMLLDEEAAALVLAGAQVVAATCIGAGDPRLAGRGYPLVVVDEATQATEPASMVAIAGKAQALLLVGDQKQLPPTVKCRAAERLGLGTSLFVRLQAMGLEPMLLDTQYRMHPEIAAFPSAAFYGGRLKNAVSAADRPLPPGFDWPNPEVPVAFVQCAGPEERTGAAADGAVGFSYQNASEAAAAAAAVRAFVRGGLAPGDVCVISPYAGQVRLLQQALLGGGSASGGGGGRSSSGARRGEEVPRGGRGGGGGGRGGGRQEGPGALAGLEVKTVDGFQGREKEVVVFSAVRSSASGGVGFLSDARRLNVAATRARRGLVVVGDAATLARDPTWRAWLAWARAKGVAPRAPQAGAPAAARFPPQRPRGGGGGGGGRRGA
ncbi:MAG: putative DNA helicase [Monoraphidium minutum]|nr:MAG: putative DNA helicase [Monoraphidium minutum]